MKLESAVAKVRNVRIATSVILALALMMMGIVSISDRISESTRDAMFWLAAILIILSVVVPVSYTIYLAKKGPDLPQEDDEKE